MFNAELEDQSLRRVQLTVRLMFAFSGIAFVDLAHLRAYCTEDEQYALLQVMEFIPYNDVPMTPVKVCEGTQAKQVAYFLK